MAPKPVAGRGALPLALSAALAWSVLPGGAAEAIEFEQADIFYELNATAGDVGVQVDLPPASGGVGSERHAAASMVIPSMPARASAGVR
jgi:hypothetical protein